MVETTLPIATHVAATGTSPALVAFLVVLGAVEVGLLAWALVDLYRRPCVADQRRQQDPLADPVPAAADHRAHRLPRGGAGAGEAGARPPGRRRSRGERRRTRWAGGATVAGARPPAPFPRRWRSSAPTPRRWSTRSSRRAARRRTAQPPPARPWSCATCARPSATRSRWTASRSACRPAPSTGSSAPTGPARRRPCASLPASRTPTPARSASSVATWRAAAPTRAASSASSPTSRPSTSG